VTQTAEIGQKAAAGLRWGLLGTVVAKAGSFMLGLVLARLLAPKEFGIFALAYAASQFLLHVNDVGIFAATVQWRGKLEDMAPTATIMAFLFSVVIYAGFWFATPFYTSGAGSPEATSVVRLLTVIILIDGVTAIRSATLVRTFRQDKLTAANVAGFGAQAIVSIILAVGGAGAFSFAWGQLACNTVVAVLVLWFTRMPMRFEFDRAVALHLLKFGAPLAVSLGIEAILVNADKTIVAGAVGATQLGYYALAFNMSSWVPGLIGVPIRYVSLPSFSRLAEESDEALSDGVQRSIPVVFAAVLPATVVMVILSTSMVTFLYGGKWAPAAAAVAIMSLVTIVRMLYPLAFDILTALGATKSTVLLNFGWCVVLIPALIVGAHYYGIKGAAIAQAAVGLGVAMPLAGLMLHRAGIRLGPMLPRLVRPLVGGVAAALVMLPLAYLTRSVSVVQLVVAGGAGLIVYVLVVVPRAEFGKLADRLRPAPAASRLAGNEEM